MYFEVLILCISCYGKRDTSSYVEHIASEAYIKYAAMLWNEFRISQINT
jgi:hypothetical protein